MNIKAKGAFKWGNAGSCASALARYEEDGYGVLAVDDWKVAGAYGFIDRQLELDVDMVSWRESFETLAASAQEGEIDLDPQENGSFFRIVKTKGKKKIALTTEKTGFGELHAQRLAAWGGAVEKIQKAELKAKQKREAERADAEKRGKALLVASHSLGEYGQGLLAESDGTVTVLAGTGLHRIGPSGVVTTHALAPEKAGFSCFARLEEATTVVWDDWSPTIAIVRSDGVRTFELARAKEAPEHVDRARVIDVLAGKPGELVVHEVCSLRRIDFDSGREIAQVPFPEIEREITPWDGRRIVARKRRAVALPEHIAFARNGDETAEIVIVDRDLRETRIEVPHRVPALAVRGDKLFALVNRSYIKAELVPVEGAALGEPIVEIDYEGRSARPIGEDAWVLCAGFKSVIRTSYTGSSYSHGWVAHLADVMRDGAAVFASLNYVGGFHVIRDGQLAWVGDLGKGINVQGVKAVGEELVAWSYGSPLFRFRKGAEKPERLLGHSGPIKDVVAIGETQFASLDEKGELRFWDLARG